MNLDKKHHSLIQAFLGAVTAMLAQPPRAQFRQGTGSRRHFHDKSNLPRGYPGAKLARQALAKTLTVKNPPVVG